MSGICACFKFLWGSGNTPQATDPEAQENVSRTSRYRNSLDPSSNLTGHSPEIDSTEAWRYSPRSSTSGERKHSFSVQSSLQFIPAAIERTPTPHPFSPPNDLGEHLFSTVAQTSSANSSPNAIRSVEEHEFSSQDSVISTISQVVLQEPTSPLSNARSSVNQGSRSPSGLYHESPEIFQASSPQVSVSSNKSSNDSRIEEVAAPAPQASNTILAFLQTHAVLNSSPTS